MSTQYPAAQAAPPPVDREIHGTLVAYEPRQNDWHRFKLLEPGRQYPINLDTKKEDIRDQALALMGQPVAVLAREQQSTTINQHTGEPFLNRWLNAIAPEGTAPGVQVYAAQQPQANAQYPQQPATTQQPTHVPPQGWAQAELDSKVGAPTIPAQPFLSELDLRIMRQCASKVATMLLPHLSPDDQNIGGLVKVAEAWMAYYVHGGRRFGVTPFDTPRLEPSSGWDGEAHDLAAQQAAHATQGGDGDIPFDPASREDIHGVTKDEYLPCPDCGFTGAHSLGCPRGDWAA